MPQAKWNSGVIADAKEDEVVIVEGNTYVSLLTQVFFGILHRFRKISISITFYVYSFPLPPLKWNI